MSENKTQTVVEDEGVLKFEEELSEFLQEREEQEERQTRMLFTDQINEYGFIRTA